MQVNRHGIPILKRGAGEYFRAVRNPEKECPVCGWEGYEDDLVSLRPGAKDGEEIYCPECENEVMDYPIYTEADRKTDLETEEHFERKAFGE